MPDISMASAGNGDRVYRAIKARAVACDFNPGEPIRLSPLATQLGVSTTPIRAALNMLVAEGLVRREPQKGFFAMSLSEDRFEGLYSLNQLLLEAALTVHRPSTELLAAAAPIVADIGNKLDDDEHCTPDAVLRYTGELFLCIAKLSNNAHVVESVERANDGLTYIRVLECQQLDGIRAELMTICELFLAERLDAAARAIADYHACRLARMPELLAALRP